MKKQACELNLEVVRRVRDAYVLGMMEKQEKEEGRDKMAECKKLREDEEEDEVEEERRGVEMPRLMDEHPIVPTFC